LSLSINPKNPGAGKEECVRETQEGFPAPFQIICFQNFYKVLKTCSAGRKDFFDTLEKAPAKCHGPIRQ
jgi:hypothetical protein